MKIIILFALMAFAAADGDGYDLEKIDMADLAENIEELTKFMDCLVDRGPCSELYLTYKVNTPNPLKDACKKCSVEQKQFGYKFFETVKTKLPEYYVLFKQKYDPENINMDKLEAELIKYKY